MGVFSDSLARAPVDAPQAEEPTIGSEASRGLSSGLRSAGANLQQLAGLGGEAVGAKDFAAARYAAAKGLRTQAEEMAPVTNTWDQVHDLRSGAHFVAGQLGAMAPVAGAAVAGGLLTGNPFTAGTIAMGLPAAGDIAARQQEDAQASQESPGTRLTKAVAGGLVSGGVQSIGPGMFAGKVLGKGAAAAGPGLGSIIAKNMAEGIGVNAAGGAAGEAISQYATNQDKPLDYAPIKDAAITGGIVGSVFGAGGAGAEALHSGGGAVRTSINDRIAASKKALGDAAGDAADSTVGKKFTSVADDVSSLFQRGTKAASDAVDRVMQGRHEGDDATMAAATPEQAADILRGSDAEQTRQSAGWGEQMMKSAGITPEQYQKVSDAMGNISEPAGRAAMAGLKKVWDLGETAVSKASALRESFKRRDVDVTARKITTPRIGDGEITDATPIKLSADYSGANKAIADKLGPLLANSQPELVNKPGAMADVADSLRQAVTQMPNKHLSADTVFRLIDSLGSDTAATLEGAYQAVGNKDPAKAENFYTSLNQIADEQSRTSKLRSLVGDSLTEKSQRLIRSSDLGELTQALIGHARGDMDNPNAGPQERASQDRQLQAMMAEHFGDKADAVMKAIKKEADARAKEEQTRYEAESGSETDSQQSARGEDGGIVTSDKHGAYDESGNRVQAQDMETISKGRGPNNDPVMDPALFASSREPGQNYAAQYIKDMQAKYPDHNVRFVKDEGSQTHGHVIAEKSADPEQLSTADLAGMKLNKKYPNSPDRLNAGGEMLDTKRIAKVMDRRLEYAPGDEQSRAHRMSRMFHEGIARLTEMHGNLDVPDSAVIGKIGGKDFTFGDSKKLSRATAEDSASDTSAQAYAALRKKYAQATWSPEKLAKAGLERVEMSDTEMSALLKAEKESRSDTEFAKNRELAGGDATGSTPRARAMTRLEGDHARHIDNIEKMGVPRDEIRTRTDMGDRPFEELDGYFDKAGNITKEGVTSLQDRDGRTATGKDDQIHLAASALGKDDVLHKSNTDGSAHSVSDRPATVSEGKNSTNDLVLAAHEWRTSDTAAARAIGERATVLLKNVQRMSEADQRKFVGVAGGSAAEASGVVNALAQKYKSGIVAPGVKGESIRAKAGDKQEINPVRFKDGKVESAPDAPKSIAKEADKQGSTGILEKAIDKRQEYLNNPPDNYSTEVAKGHLDWAARQKERVDAEYEKAKTGDDVERQGQLSDLRGSLGRLITKAKSVLEGDASLKDFEGSTPGPKEVAAKKAALLERAASGDKQSVEQMGQKFPELELRRPTLKERAEVSSIQDQVASRLGGDMPEIKGVSVRDGAKTASAGKAVTVGNEHHIILSRELFDDSTKLLGSVDDKVERALTHEIGHLLDRDNGNFSDKSERFFPDGDLHAEIKGYAGSSESAKDWFGYALDAVRTPQRELFAQAFTMFHYNPEAMREALPKTYRLFEDGIGRQREGGSDANGRPGDGAAAGRSIADKKAALLESAKSNDAALNKELSASNDAKGLQRAVELLAEKAPGSEALKAANERLSQLVQDPDVAYGLLTKKYSAESTSPGTSNAPGSRPDVAEHITKVLGDSVKLKWADLTHAGEFERMRLHDVIRLSVHALDPMSTAYHESLHAFFAQLKDAKATDISSVLEKAAASEHVMAQLTERFKNEPEVLKQLKDPEERAAYMYQMWAADPTFKVSIAAKGVFGKIADFIRGALGIWSNDERALHIMQYFNEGKYAQDMKNPSVVRDAVMTPGRNQVIDAAHSFTKPLAGFADSIVGSGSSRLRDTGVKALGELADLIKREHTTEGGDQGYIQAARMAMTKRMGSLGDALNGYSPEQLQSAMEQLQSGKKADTPEARIAARTIQKTLADTKAYMEKSGLEMGDLGPDYFPRVWDNHYISKNLPAFRDMLEPYVRRGEFKGSIDQFIQNLGSREGNEFGIEKTQPGMQFSKARLLSFIKPEDASQFLKKDLFGTMSSYVGQATRLAEWNRRLGGGKLEELMSRAKDEGATPDQLGMVDNYLKGVNGTLGDNLNPHIRRLMGNMIVYQNVRLLPMAAFSMLIDPSGVMVRGGTVKDAWSTFKRGMSELPQTFSKNAKPDEATRLAELTGVIDSAMLTHTMGDLYTQGMVGGTAKSINNTFFKYNMVEGLNRSFRVGASEAAMNFLARHADGTNSTHSERFMNELGIQKGDIIPTQDGRIALTTADGLKPEQVERVHAAVNQWVDGAILRPDAADKPIWMNDPRFALVSHLKQFVYSFQKTILDRTMHEMKHGNYTPAMALASYVPVMMAADFLKGALVSGGGQPEWQKGWDIADYVGYGMQRAGLAGVGQFGLDIAKDIHRGGIGIGALTGPTIEQFGDAVQLMGGHKQFGPMLLNAMPANALYAHAFGGGNVPDPMFAE